MTINDTLLLVSPTEIGDSVALALNAAGYQVAIANTELRAVALVFLMRSFAAVIVDERQHANPSFALASRLHGIRPDVPIVVISKAAVSSVPGCVEACVLGQELPNAMTALLGSALACRQNVAA